MRRRRRENPQQRRARPAKRLQAQGRHLQRPRAQPRPYDHPDQHTHTYRHIHQNPGAVTEPARHSKIHTRPEKHTTIHAVRDGDIHPERDVNSNRHVHQHGKRDTHAHSHGQRRAHRNRYRYSDSTPSATTTSTPTVTRTATFTVTATFRPVSTPPLPDPLVISEFRTRGQNGAGDEFIEIFNPSGQSVAIGGWQIKKSSGCGISTTILLTISSGVQLAAGQHFLAAPAGANSGQSDQNFTAGIADSGGIALLDSQGRVIASAGMCADTAYLEEDPFPPLASSSLDQSYERMPGGCSDSNNNLADFRLTAPSHPENLSSPFTICTDTSTATTTTSATPTASATETPTDPPSFTDTSTPAPVYTPTATLTRTPTFTPMPTAAPTSHILISEFRTHGQNGAGDEFIEIFNPSGETVEIGGWLLKRSSGCGTSVSTLLTISGGIQLLPGQHFLAAPSGASINTPDQKLHGWDRG